MISNEKIRNLAALARVEVSEGELQSLSTDIAHIVDYVASIATFESETIEKKAPLHHNVMREDVVYEEGTPLYSTEKALVSAFPKERDSYLVVRKIIQKDE